MVTARVKGHNIIRYHGTGLAVAGLSQTSPAQPTDAGREMSTSNGPSAEPLPQPLSERVSLGKKIVAWMRRRPAAATLIAAVVLVSGTGLAGIVWQWHQRMAERQENEAALQSLAADLYFRRIALAHSELARKDR